VQFRPNSSDITLSCHFSWSPFRFLELSSNHVFVLFCIKYKYILRLLISGNVMNAIHTFVLQRIPCIEQPVLFFQMLMLRYAKYHHIQRRADFFALKYEYNGMHSWCAF
jgi:hypothetical protein